jgi:hypothetical protein
MAIKGDGPGSKLFLLFIMIVLFYLAFFGFDFGKAYTYATTMDSSLLQSFGF